LAPSRGKVGLITLNRPKVNAASDGLLQDVIAACKVLAPRNPRLL
jgi:enoyl-CoA hydratase/carnithine racemase